MNESIYSKRSNLILGFHGCDKSVADKVIHKLSGLSQQKYEYALERMDKSEPSLSTTRRIVNILKLSPEQVLAI